MNTFVSIGNARQPFTRLLNEIVRKIDIFPHPVIVQHGHTPFDFKGCTSMAFVSNDEYHRLVAHSSLLIMHGGAGSIINALRQHKLPVVVPRLARYGEHVNNHQLDLCSKLSEIGKVVMVERVEDLGDVILRFKDPLHDHTYSQDTRLISSVKSILENYRERII